MDEDAYPILHVPWVDAYGWSRVLQSARPAHHSASNSHRIQRLNPGVKQVARYSLVVRASDLRRVRSTADTLSVGWYWKHTQGRRRDSKSEGDKTWFRERSERKFFFVPPLFQCGGTSKQMSVLNTLKFAVWLSHYSGGSRHLHVSPQRMAQIQNFYIWRCLSLLRCR